MAAPIVRLSHSLCICMCVYIYVYVYIYIYIERERDRYTYIHLHTSTYIYIYMFMCMYVYIYIYTYLHIHYIITRIPDGQPAARPRALGRGEVGPQGGGSQGAKHGDLRAASRSLRLMSLMCLLLYNFV